MSRHPARRRSSTALVAAFLAPLAFGAVAASGVGAQDAHTTTQAASVTSGTSADHGFSTLDFGWGNSMPANTPV
jgi:hypothetical protein